ncbi:MAG TPA: hypothetical protein VK098_09340 [Beutenbergiaceae bacterium]|nr:hypothetical protein [Beutenbergiaceae bacterium]
MQQHVPAHAQASGGEAPLETGVRQVGELLEQGESPVLLIGPRPAATAAALLAAARADARLRPGDESTRVQWFSARRRAGAKAWSPLPRFPTRRNTTPRPEPW